MSTLIEFPTDDGESVIVEVDTAAAGVAPAGVAPGQVARQATQTFERSLDRIGPVAATTVKRMAALTEAPEEVTVAFGIKLSADFGAILAHAAGEANITVTLRWSRPRQSESS